MKDKRLEMLLDLMCEFRDEFQGDASRPIIVSALTVIRLYRKTQKEKKRWMKKK